MAASNIRIKKICQWCGVEFEAQKVSTKYCSHRCANLAYKQAVRDQRVKQAENETHHVRTEKPIENIKEKEYLSIAQTATLLGLSLQAVYKMIYAGHLVAYTCSLKCLAPFVQRYSNFSNCFGQMLSILQCSHLMTIFPRFTNNYCNRRTNDELPTLSPLVYALCIANPNLTYNL